MTTESQMSKEELKANIKQDVKSGKAELAGAARAQAEAGKDKAADKLNDLSEAIDQVASSISENDKLGLASYVHDTSARLASLANLLQERSVDELAHEAKDLARRKPTAFMLGSVMVGFGLSRFLKASTHHDTADNYRSSAQQNYPPAADFSTTRTL